MILEAELIKKNINTSYPSASLKLDILTEGDSIVPDSKSDICKILWVEGMSVIEKTEIQKGRVIFTGVSDFTVLYTPEENSFINSITVKIPFNHIEECPNVTPEDKFKVCAETVHTECNLINSRKISLKAVVRVDFKSFTDQSLAVPVNIKAPSVETKCEDVSFSFIESSVSECFNVSDTLEVPSGKPSLDTLLLCKTQIKDSSVKIVTGKAVIKGCLSIFNLYLADDGCLSYMQHDLPFTEILDIPNLSENMYCDTTFSVKNISVSKDFLASEDGRSISFSGDICVSVLVFSKEETTIVKDAYVPCMELALSHCSCKRSEIISRFDESLTLKESIDLPINMPPMEQVCPVSGRIKKLDAFSKNGKINISGTIEANITYLSYTEDPISFFNCDITFSSVYDCPVEDANLLVKASISHMDFNFINQAKLDVRGIISLDIMVLRNKEDFLLINEVSLEECINKNRPSIVIYFVKSGDTLWDIAKRYSTTVEKIASANDISENELIHHGMRILIPA